MRARLASVRDGKIFEEAVCIQMSAQLYCMFFNQQRARTCVCVFPLILFLVVNGSLH